MNSVNGYGPHGGLVSGQDGGKALNGSKMSLNSYGSSASSGKFLANGHASMQSLGEFEEKTYTLVMEPKDRRFGFSVFGGIDQEAPPQIDNISPDSPASRVGLKLNDEILEVNGSSIHQMTHTEIIMQIHKCKNNIVLKIRRYGVPAILYENGDVHEMAIDVPPYYNDTSKHVNKPLTEPPVQARTGGMLKYARTQPSTKNLPNRESNIPAKYYNEAFENDERNRDSHIPSKFVNEAFDEDKEDGQQVKLIGLAQFITLLDEMGKKLKGENFQDDVTHLRHLFSLSTFQSAVKTHNEMTKIQHMKKSMEIFKPVGANSQFLLSDVSHLVMQMNAPAAVELLQLVNKPHVKELLGAHDIIARREAIDTGSVGSDDSQDYDGSVNEEYSEDEDETPCKIVRIDKTNMHLGATVRNEGDAVIISRIIKGGAAEKSGVLNEGDEILEINNESVRGKNVNEVVELLSELDGTLTFVLLPSDNIHKEPLQEDTVVMKALFDYDPRNDDMLPCEELGLQFRKGDVLEILNQNDPDWWQARPLDNETSALLAGLIPSKAYQKQRERAKIALKGEDTEPIVKEKKQCFCGRTRRKNKRRSKKKTKKSKRNAPIEDNEPLTYEDMVMRHPDPARKRPIVLIGPPQVGRRELKQRLIQQFPERYAAPVAHTTRSPTHDELSGVDYIFYTKVMFDRAILASEFVEYGQHDGHYYGTSFKAVRDVISNGKTCILSIHCAGLPILKNSYLLPYVIFITLPSINRVKQLRETDTNMEPFNPTVRLKESQIDDIIEQARDMNRSYGHYFDKSIVNSDFDQSYDKLLEICTSLERDPQWVPASWLPGG